MPTTTAFNVLIWTMEHVSECVPEVEAILTEMKSCGVRIDSSTYTAAVVTCARSGHFDFVLSVLDQASLAFIELPLSTFHSVLSAFEKSGQFQNAIDLFQHMKESSNVQPSLMTYTSVITCCARAGQWAKALELLNESTFRGFELTSTVFNACISACEKGRQLEKAVEVLRQMDSLRIPANAVTYNSIERAVNAAMFDQKSLEVEHAVNDLIDIILNVLRCSKRVFTWGQYRSQDISKLETFHTRIARDKKVVKLVLLMCGSIEGVKIQVIEYLATFGRYIFGWQNDKQAAYQNFMKGNPALNAFEGELRVYMELENEINAISTFHNIGCIALETTPIKNVLKHECQVWRRQFADNLHKSAKEQLDGLL